LAAIDSNNIASYYFVNHDGDDKYTADFNTYTAYTIPPTPYPTLNTITSAGTDGSPPTVAIYYFNSPPSWSASQGTVPEQPFYFARLDDGTMYAILSSGAVYISDETLDPPVLSGYTHSAGGLPGLIKVA